MTIYLFVAFEKPIYGFLKQSYFQYFLTSVTSYELPGSCRLYLNENDKASNSNICVKAKY